MTHVMISKRRKFRVYVLQCQTKVWIQFFQMKYFKKPSKMCFRLQAQNGENVSATAQPPINVVGVVFKLQRKEKSMAQITFMLPK